MGWDGIGEDVIELLDFVLPALHTRMRYEQVPDGLSFLSPRLASPYLLFGYSIRTVITRSRVPCLLILEKLRERHYAPFPKLPMLTPCRNYHRSSPAHI